MSDDLLALAARCEAASGPDQMLDIKIAMAIGMPGPGSGPSVSIPWFTASLDAAISLVPAGAHWSISWPVAQVELVFSGGPVINADAASPALAVCSAALKARSRASQVSPTTAPEE